MMLKLFIFLLTLVSVTELGAVSMNFKGHFRSEASYYNNAGLGASSTNLTKAYLAARGLLNPDIVVDDHFSIKSQWNLLTSPNFTPQPTGPYIFGDNSSTSLLLTRAWLEWTSDFGVFRVGRMPVSWGYGLIWDAGNGIWDDFATTYDRMEYRLHLGHVVGAVAYSKPRKGSTQGSENDSENYTAYLQYDNPEMDVEGGLLFEKQVRSHGQMADLINNSIANPYQLPVNYPNAKKNPLAIKFPAPLSINILDAYLKKSFGYFTFGGEIGWATGTAADYGATSNEVSMKGFGVVLSATYEFHKFRAFLETLYASGDNNLKDNELTGFVILHRNRRFGLILGRELLGQYYDNGARLGSLVSYGNADTFSGVLGLRPGIRFDWSNSWSSGAEFIIARKASAAAGESENLGIEVDLGTQYAVYRNFDMGLNLGYLFPGLGLQVANPQGVFGFQTTAALRF